MGILGRLRRIELCNAVTAADTRALLPPAASPKPPKLAASPAITDGDTEPVLTKKAKALALAAVKLEAAGLQQTATPPVKGQQQQKPAPVKLAVNQLSFVTRAGVDMTPVRRITHLRNTLKNAEAALSAPPAEPLIAAPFGKTVAKAPPAHIVEAKAKAAAAAKAAATLTAQNLVAATGGKKTPRASSPAGSTSTAKSQHSVNGARTGPNIPGPGYECHVCGSSKHFRNECPREKDKRAERQARLAGGTGTGGGKARGKGSKGFDPAWAATQPCRYEIDGAACRGKDSLCAFKRRNLADHADSSIYDRCLDVISGLHAIRN